MAHKKKTKPTALSLMLDTMIDKAVELTKQDIERKSSARLVSERRKDNPSPFFRNSQVIPTKKRRKKSGK